ncbi:sigma 54-interacting transcriptional regulator [bacterium]|nr:sigma 54-interacting transcriptional regulator [bacterium]
MIGKQFRFGLCSSTQSLVKQVKEMVVEYNINLEVSFSSMDYAIADAKRMEADGVELIMAGNITGAILMEHVRIPVVIFSFKQYDTMENIAKAVEKGKKIIVPVLNQKIPSPASLANLLGVEIKHEVYYNIESLRRMLDKAKEEGFELVYGGGYITEYARQIGLQTIDFFRSESSVRETIKSALSIGRAGRQAIEKSHRYRLILDSASEGVIAVDKSGKITAINRTACELLDLEEKVVTDNPIQNILPKTAMTKALSTSRQITDSIEKHKSKTFVWNHKPFDVAGDVAGCVSTFSEISAVMRSENKIRQILSKGHVARYVVEDILHQSEIMKETINDARQYAKTNSNLLITGETGTGKELMAQSIHNLSIRKKLPFISMNCAALPIELLESELFGYEEGAFTGSRRGGKPGLFELAHKGTIFLDEIGETSEKLQVGLLRVLQEREIMRLGGDRLINIDVRIIAASNRDLAKEVRNGNFRRDLFYRLNILRIHIPPLRDRVEDIPILLEVFIRSYSGRNVLPFKIPEFHLEQLKAYPWPGNVRQLQNFTERLVLLSQSKFSRKVFEKIYRELVDHHVETLYTPSMAEEKPISQPNENSQFSEKPDNDGVDHEKKWDQLKLESEKEILQTALEKAHYSKNKAAKNLGISRSTLWARMKKTGLA